MSFLRNEHSRQRQVSRIMSHVAESLARGQVALKKPSLAPPVRENVGVMCLFPMTCRQIASPSIASARVADQGNPNAPRLTVKVLPGKPLLLTTVEPPNVHRAPARLNLAVRPEGAKHLWRRIPPGELSIGPEADERLGRA